MQPVLRMHGFLPAPLAWLPPGDPPGRLAEPSPARALSVKQLPQHCKASHAAATGEMAHAARPVPQAVPEICPAAHTISAAGNSRAADMQLNRAPQGISFLPQNQPCGRGPGHRPPAAGNRNKSLNAAPCNLLLCSCTIPSLASMNVRGRATGCACQLPARSSNK